MQLVSLFYHFCSLGRGGVSHGYDPKLPPWKGGGDGSSQREGEPLFVAVLWRGANKPKYARNEGDLGGTFLEGGCSVTDWSERKLSPTFSSSFAAAD